MARLKKKHFPIFFTLLSVTLVSLACGLITPLQGEQIPTENSGSNLNTLPVQKAEVFFWVELPAPLNAEETLQLVLLDEVTGLPYNQERIEMQMVDDTNYGISIVIPIGSLVKYRYERSNAGFFQEYLSSGEPVRYRLYQVESPGETHDIVSNWEGASPVQPAGRIVGNTFDASTGRPIPNIFLSAGGVWAISAFDGSFILEGLPPGEHNLIAYTQDGSAYPFQQRAVVASNAATPASVPLERTELVDVTFVITVPEDTAQGIPIRIAGNLFQLGNTFSDLGGGVSGYPPNMPTLSPIDQNRYTITLKLPKGIDIRYKYTYGDGITNAEHRYNGAFNVHHLFIPRNSQPILIQDNVESWQMKQSASMWFEVTTPPGTPSTDQIFIQTKLSGWLAPIPMWKVAENLWAYEISSPTFANTLEYRYCRNGQCTSSNEFGAETLEQPREVNFPKLKAKLVKDEVMAWNYLSSGNSSPTVLSDQIKPRSEGFATGFAIAPIYSPTMSSSRSQTFEEIKLANANLVVIQPSWTAVSQTSTQLIDQVIGKNPDWNETAFQIEIAHQYGLKTAIYPHIKFSGLPQEWWRNAPVSDIWWRIWFERYRQFVLHYANLAEATGAETLVLGGEWLSPAIPDIISAKYPSYDLPGNSISIWEQIIADVKQAYSGQIAWYLPYSQLNQPPPFLDAVDIIYLDMGASLANSTQPSLVEIQSQAKTVLREEIKPFMDSLNKPLILVLSYPSADGGATNCLPISPDIVDCLPLELLLPGQPEQTHISIDLEEQVDVYNAIFAAVNDQGIVNGVISGGFFPSLGLEDKSISVHGKPAQTVISYWFAQFLGK